ncbi:hypothetical protein BH09PSE6_BH09PSE6_19080 [soil metagenome]
MKQLSGLLVSTVLAATIFTAPASADELPPNDRTLVELAARHARTEIDGARLALSKAARPDVKSFADEMSRDHQAMLLELVTLATAKGVKLPDDASAAQRTKLRMLATKDGNDLERLYVFELGVKAHEDVIAWFKWAATNATDAEVRAWAGKSLPVLERHLARALALQASLPRKDMKTNRKDA